MKGRKPLPSHLKLVQGTARKSRENKLEPEFAKERPDCPNHLDELAKLEWSRMVARLMQAGLLTEIDGSALAAYCQAYSRWAEAEEKLKKTGLVVKSPSGYPIQSPYLPIANKAMEMMHKFMTEFGLTPSSRSRLRAPKTDDHKKNPWDSI